MLVRLIELGGDLVLYRADAEDVEEQDINAQVMPPEMFERLTETIKRDGRLESLPFGVLRKAQTDGRQKIELVSGHHRLRASRSAGVNTLHFLVDERDLTRSQVVAKQLAHNAIAGESDPMVLKRLYEEIQSVDDILEAFVKPEDFDGVRQLDVANLPKIGVAIEYRKISFVFLPNDAQRMKAIESAAQEIPKGTATVGVVDLAVFERFRKMALALGSAKEIRSMGALVAMMCDIVEAQLQEEAPKDANAA